MQTGQTPLDVARDAWQIKTAALLEAFLRAEPAHEVIAEAGANVRNEFPYGYPARKLKPQRDRQFFLFGVLHKHMRNASLSRSFALPHKQIGVCP